MSVPGTEEQDPIIALMHGIVHSIDELQYARGKALPEDWESFALVIGVRPDGRYSDSYGFAYGSSGWVRPVSADPDVVRDPLVAFMKDRYPDAATMPVKVLFQLRLSDGAYDVTFEDSDRTRWQVTPLNYAQVPAELKPNFGE